MSTGPRIHIGFVIDDTQKRNNVDQVKLGCGSGWLKYTMQREIAEDWLREEKMQGFIYKSINQGRSEQLLQPGHEDHYKEVLISEDVCMYFCVVEMIRGVPFTDALGIPAATLQKCPADHPGMAGFPGLHHGQGWL